MNKDEGKLPDVLSFLTGSEAVPVLGFDKDPTVSFGHKEDLPENCPTEPFPVVNTCSLNLRLPILDNFETFKIHFVNAFEQACTFSDI